MTFGPDLMLGLKISDFFSFFCDSLFHSLANLLQRSLLSPGQSLHFSFVVCLQLHQLHLYLPVLLFRCEQSEEEEEEEEEKEVEEVEVEGRV